MPDHNNPQTMQCSARFSFISVALESRDVIAADRECPADIATERTGSAENGTRGYHRGTVGNAPVAAQHSLAVSSGPGMSGEIPGSLAGRLQSPGGSWLAGFCESTAQSSLVSTTCSSSSAGSSVESLEGKDHSDPYESQQDGTVRVSNHGLGGLRFKGRDHSKMRTNSNSLRHATPENRPGSCKTSCNYGDSASFSGSSSDEELVPVLQRIKATHAAAVTTRERHSRESGARNQKQPSFSAMSTEKTCENECPRGLGRPIALPGAINDDVTRMQLKECDTIPKLSCQPPQESNSTCKVDPVDDKQRRSEQGISVGHLAGNMPMYVNLKDHGKKIASCGPVQSVVNTDHFASLGHTEPVSSYRRGTGKESGNCSTLTSGMLTDILSNAGKKQLKSKTSQTSTSKCGDSADRPIVVD